MEVPKGNFNLGGHLFQVAGGWERRGGWSRALKHPPVLLEQRDHVSDSPGIAFGGVELVPVLDKIALSLLLSSSSRSSSFLICTFLCSIAYCCTLVSIVGCQLAALWP